MTEADPLDTWPAFAEAVRERLEASRATYGGRSFSLPPAVLVGELEAEALDLAGWGFVLWSRLRALRAAAEVLEPAGSTDAVRRALVALHGGPELPADSCEDAP